jgi:hypothetical protein
MESMYYIGLDVHKKTISYCVKDGSDFTFMTCFPIQFSWLAPTSSVDFPCQLEQVRHPKQRSSRRKGDERIDSADVSPACRQ